MVAKVSLCLFLVLTIFFISKSKSAATAADPPHGGWQLADSAWPTNQYNFQRTGRSPYTGIIDRPAPSWRSSEGFSYSQMTVGISNTLYVKTGDQTYSLDFNGNLVQTGLPGDSCRSSPVHLANGYIFYGAGLNWWALDADGNVIWTVPFIGACFDMLAAVRSDGIAYFGYGFGLPDLYGVNGSTGEVLWGGEQVYGLRPAIGSDGTIYSVLYDGGFKALTADGDFLWEKTDLDYEGHPAIGDDGTIYTTTYDPDNGEVNLRALNPDSSIEWDYLLDLRPCGIGYPGPAIGLDGTIYIGAGFQGDDNPEVYFYAVNPDGSLKWRYVRPPLAIGIAPPVCVPAVVDNHDNVYFCDTNSCHAFANDGRLLWSFGDIATVFSTLVIAEDGLIMVPTIEGVKALVPAVGISFFPVTFSAKNSP